MKYVKKLLLLSLIPVTSIFAEPKISSKQEPLTGYKYIHLYEQDENISSKYDMDDENVCYTYDDPFEKINRPLLYFNGALDYIILRPIAITYKKVIPSNFRTIIGNFVDNLAIPFSIVNNLLQFDFKGAANNISVFSINSVWGIGGFFDVVGHSGLKHKKQYFGDTLAKYGVLPGPYLMVPFFGPTNTRDLMDILFKGHIDPIPYIIPKHFSSVKSVVKLVHDRSMIIGPGESVISKSADPYAALRSVQYQQREDAVEYPTKKPKCNPEFYKNLRKK